MTIIDHTGARYTPSAPPQFMPRVRPMRDDEFPWVVHSWSEGYKNSPNMRRKRWEDYRVLDVPVLRDAIARPDTIVLVCEGDVPGRGVGWLAYAPWPSIDVLHWIYVTMQYRKRGVMTALLEAARIRKRVAYTHKAAIRRGETRADLWITEKLRGRGIVVSHAPYKEWSR